jgi:hypothetical protein
MNFRKLLSAALTGILLCGAAAAALADPLQNVLADSKATGKGLTFYVNGQAVPGIVVSVDDKYVVARSTANGTIVIRLDRLDGVAGHVALPAERK